MQTNTVTTAALAVIAASSFSMMTSTQLVPGKDDQNPQHYNVGVKAMVLGGGAAALGAALGGLAKPNTSARGLVWGGALVALLGFVALNNPKHILG